MMCSIREIKTYRKYPEKGDNVKRTYKNGDVLIFKVLRNIDEYYPYSSELVIKVKLLYSSSAAKTRFGLFFREVGTSFYEEIFYDKDYDILHYACHDEKITNEELMLEML